MIFIDFDWLHITQTVKNILLTKIHDENDTWIDRNFRQHFIKRLLTTFYNCFHVLYVCNDF